MVSLQLYTFSSPDKKQLLFVIPATQLVAALQLYTVQYGTLAPYLINCSFFCNLVISWWPAFQRTYTLSPYHLHLIW